MTIKKVTNHCDTLYQANVLAGEDNNRDVNRMLYSIQYDLNAYKYFIEHAIATERKQVAIKVNLKPKIQENEVRLYIEESDSVTEKRINVALFERNITYVQENLNDKYSPRLYIIHRQEEERYIVLDHINTISDAPTTVYIVPYIYQLQKQKEAIKRLKDEPRPYHLPLLKLFSDPKYNIKFFEKINAFSFPQWHVLTDSTRDGTQEQRQFVEKALGSPDFALLEGPPGSGKTTAIIELILQCVKRKQRVLLCSATHVAIDNVLDRLLTKHTELSQQYLMPIRISANKNSIRKDSVLPHRLQEVVQSYKKTIRRNLQQQSPKSASQQRLLKALKGDKDRRHFEETILDSANLVAGTMIGILQHPSIKNQSTSLQPFDVMIVDEASKVTFTDFLVPAIHAKKWILVGDVQQLSPYVEDNYVTAYLNSLVKPDLGNNIVSHFELKKELDKQDKDRNKKWFRTPLTILLSPYVGQEDVEQYEKKNLLYEEKKLLCEKKNLLCAYLDATPKPTDILRINALDIILCKPENIHHILPYIYVPCSILDSQADSHLAHTDFIHRQQYYYRNKNKPQQYYTYHKNDLLAQNWGQVLASVLSQYYQYRFNPKNYEHLNKHLKYLTPPHNNNTTKSLTEITEQVRRIAFPSILELLQKGIGETFNKGKQIHKFLYSGFERHESIMEHKFQRLTYQHRMQPAIAKTSSTHFYKSINALQSANTVTERQDKLQGFLSAQNVIWYHNNNTDFRKLTKGQRLRNVNRTEVRHIKDVLEKFRQFTQGREPLYEVAVLSFYADQVQALRKMLRRLCRQPRQYKNFTLSNIKITLCTVDKFQGDEADMVLLSFTKFSKGAFYHSPNRLNVALTRAKYKLLLFGNQEWLKEQRNSEALNFLATNFPSALLSR